MKIGRLINIVIVVFVDLLGFGLILPLLPYYAETFGATPAVIGLIVASYAAASLIGAAFWVAFPTASAGVPSFWLYQSLDFLPLAFNAHHLPKDSLIILSIQIPFINYIIRQRGIGTGEG